MASALLTEKAEFACPDDAIQRSALIERLIASSVFRKAGRLRDLMRYLAARSLAGETADLTEQRIGEAVFGKPAGYSPVEDSSVRVHMRQLRLKLHEYFDSEGRDEPLIVEIPRGGYVLSFHPVAAQAIAKIPEPVAIPQPRAMATLLPWALVATLSILCVFLWLRTCVATPPPVPWPLSSVFSNGTATRIVVADASITLRRGGRVEPISLEEYIKRDLPRNEPAPAAQSPADSFVARYTANALLTSYADVAVVSTFLKMLSREARQVSVRSARDVRLRDMEDGSHVLLGSPSSNPWVLLFENKLNFREVRDIGPRGASKYFLNKNPREGESASFHGLTGTGEAGDDYASIALLPASSKGGHVLIIQGLQQEGTEAAGHFLADESGRRKLKQSLGLRDDPETPVYFEALLKIGSVAGSPGSAAIVATRLIKP